MLEKHIRENMYFYSGRTHYNISRCIAQINAIKKDKFSSKIWSSTTVFEIDDNHKYFL